MYVYYYLSVHIIQFWFRDFHPPATGDNTGFDPADPTLNDRNIVDRSLNPIHHHHHKDMLMKPADDDVDRLPPVGVGESSKNLIFFLHLQCQFPFIWLPR